MSQDIQRECLSKQLESVPLCGKKGLIRTLIPESYPCYLYTYCTSDFKFLQRYLEIKMRLDLPEHVFLIMRLRILCHVSKRASLCILSPLLSLSEEFVAVLLFSLVSWLMRGCRMCVSLFWITLVSYIYIYVRISRCIYIYTSRWKLTPTEAQREKYF